MLDQRHVAGLLFMIRVLLRITTKQLMEEGPNQEPNCFNWQSIDTYKNVRLILEKWLL